MLHSVLGIFGTERFSHTSDGDRRNVQLAPRPAPKPAGQAFGVEFKLTTKNRNGEKTMNRLLILLAPFFIASCATLMPELIPAPQIVHEHKLVITDLKGNPIEGVKVSEIGLNNKDIVLNSTITTSSDGVIYNKFNVSSDPKHPSIHAYSTMVKYKVEKEGFYKASAFTSIFKSGQRSETIASVQSDVKTLNLIRPTDFFSEQYLASVASKELKGKILAFIDDIRAEGFLANAYLTPYSIDLSTFKGKKYLTFCFNNSNVYNSLKLNKYEIGKRLFDEVVRKVLNPMNNYISNPKEFDGYDITVVGYMKDFSENTASNKKLEYRFLMPEVIVMKYKEKEITGQGLIDSSIVLLDDERIDLKLQ